LLSEGTYRQQFGSEAARISATRTPTNVLNVADSDLI
jgi:hypothetical protein